MVFQVAWLILATTIVGVSSYVSGATPLVIVTSLTGIWFVVGVAFGHKHANLFGAILAACLGYLSYEAGFYGNVAMHMATVVMSLYGWWRWSKNQTEEGSVKQESLTTKERINGAFLLCMFISLACIGTYSVGSSLWFLDGVTMVLPIFATVLLITAKKEQWYLWGAVNAIEIYMWLMAASLQPEVLAIFVLRVVFLVNNLLGFYLWNIKKEIV